MEKLMVFIDGMNLLRAWKSTCEERNFDRRTRWDAIKLRDTLTILGLDQNLVQIRYYSSTISTKDARYLGFLRGVDPKGFHQFLERKGYKCIIGKNRVRHEDCPLCNQEYPRIKEKGIDVAIALDMVIAGIEEKFDVALLVSGDADFIPAIKILQDRGKTVEVAQFQNVISWHLRHAANKVHELDQHFEELILK